MINQISILVIAESLRINSTSSGIVSSTTIKLLSDAGFDVDVLTENNFDYNVNWLPKNVNVIKLDVKLSTPNFFDRIPKVKAYHSYIYGYNKQANDIIQSYKRSIFDLTSKKKYNFIYLLGSGNSFYPYLIFPCKEINIPYIANIHDPYPNHLYPEPYKKKVNFIYKKQEKAFKKVLEGAYKITFPSKYLLDHMANTFTAIKDKGIVVPHIGTRLKNLQYTDSDDLVTLPQDKINIIHAGNLLGPRNPLYLIKAIQELNQESSIYESEVLFTFFGTFNKEHKELIKNTNISNIKFNQNRVSYKKSCELMAQADANLVIEAIADFSPFLPGKVADIAFSDKSIIALTPKKSEVNRVLGANYPYTSTLDDVHEIKKVLKNFINDFKLNKIDKVFGENLKKYVSIENNSENIKKIFDI